MDEKKKSIFKKIAIAIGGFFVALISFIIYGTTNRRLNNNRAGTDGVGNNIDKAVASNRDAEKRVEELKHTAESLTTRNEDIKSSTEHCINIIGNIRKRGKKK